MVGQTISHYRIEEKLGQGAMGVVYRARDTRLGRAVTLKMLLPESVAEPTLRRRLATEARAASALNHPVIATVHDFEIAGDSVFIVYEYVEGSNLRELIRKRPLGLPEILSIFISIADGLAAAHKTGIVHRDLKPENVMITPDGRVKLLDFGVAKVPLQVAKGMTAVLGDSTGATLSTMGTRLVGTVNYMSPEQLQAEEVDHRSDVFSFGVTLYEMAAQRHPFVGKSLPSTISNILKEEPPSLARWRPQAPAELERVIRKCLRKQPGERYQSVRDLLLDLEQVRRGLTGGVPATPQVPVEAEFAMSRGLARALLLVIQLGYVGIYSAALHYADSVEQTLEGVLLMPAWLILPLVIVSAMCGIAVRLYLLSAVGLDHRATGLRFRRLFPALLALDALWAASPLLLVPKIHYGVALSCVAGLAYLPFSQRTLIQSAYQAPTSPLSTGSGGRSDDARTI